MERHKASFVPCALCAVYGTADRDYMRDYGVYVVPITMLMLGP